MPAVREDVQDTPFGSMGSIIPEVLIATYFTFNLKLINHLVLVMQYYFFDHFLVHGIDK